MTAKEMFEKLGYEYDEDNFNIMYDQRVGIYKAISFWKDNKTFYKQEGFEPGDITLDELQAINKQVEELGWNEQ